MPVSVKSYADLTEDQRITHRVLLRPGQCEQDGGHVVEKPKVWPPRQRSQGRRAKDYASVPCTRCGAWVVIYDPLQEGVRWADAPKAASKG